MVNKSPRVFVFVVLLVCCAALAYFWIDRSISLSYARASLESTSASMRQLEWLLADAWRGSSERDVMAKLRNAEARRPQDSIVIKKEGNTIWFDDLGFHFVDDALVSVGRSGDKKLK